MLYNIISIKTRGLQHDLKFLCGTLTLRNQTSFSTRALHFDYRVRWNKLSFKSTLKVQAFSFLIKRQISQSRRESGMIDTCIVFLNSIVI